MAFNLRNRSFLKEIDLVIAPELDRVVDAAKNGGGVGD